MRHSKQYYLRRTHRYLGLFIGIQFFLWTIGGLYFSWSDIHAVHGDPQRKPPPLMASDTAWVSPGAVLRSLQAGDVRVDSIVSIRLVQVLAQPCWQIIYENNNQKQAVCLADARTGNIRAALTRDEAVQVAQQQFRGAPDVTTVAYLESLPPGHEYRENALPAWAVTFNHPTETTVYVAAELGTVEKFRNNNWRWFDWLWMFHTMDFKERDDINNRLLRAFSILGLLTISSGFLLFAATSPLLQKIRTKV